MQYPNHISQQVDYRQQKNRLTQLIFILSALLLASLLSASITPAAAATLSCPTAKYDIYFKKYSKKYFGPLYDWRWFKAVAITESGLCPSAKSNQGAQGLMQLMPATYNEIRLDIPYLKKDSFHVESNIHAGIFYLHQLHKKWQQALPQHATAFMLASYNGGMGRVQRAQKKSSGTLYWSSIKPYLPGETQRYVGYVQKAYVSRLRKDQL